MTPLRIRLFSSIGLVASALLPALRASAQTAPASPPTVAPAPATAAPEPAPSPPGEPTPAAAPAPADTTTPPAAPPASSGPAAPQPLAAGASQRNLAGPSSPYDGPPLLLGPGKLKLGAYGALGIAYTHMLHRDGVATSLEGAVLINHRLSIGLAGYVFSRTPEGPDAYDGTSRQYSTGYGGLVIRYAAFTDFPVYASAGALVGGGVLALTDHWDSRDEPGRSWDDDDSPYYRSHGYFVVQPDISLHANATRWLRFTVTGGYRFATAVGRQGYDGTAMSGAVVGGRVELGWF